MNLGTQIKVIEIKLADNQDNIDYCNRKLEAGLIESDHLEAIRLVKALEAENQTLLVDLKKLEVL